METIPIQTYDLKNLPPERKSRKRMKTKYKCKRCDFTASSIPELGQHTKKQHPEAISAGRMRKLNGVSRVRRGKHMPFFSCPYCGNDLKKLADMLAVASKP